MANWASEAGLWRGLMKRIVICADGTWNRPEKDLAKDFPTNVLMLARAIQPVAEDGVSQQVFYDWGIGSYYDSLSGGITGKGLHKNIMDDYRYIVQNYSPGDEIYLFGFSRGAYTVRCLSGLINNCGILKRPDARLIQQAFDIYKYKGEKYTPDGAGSVAFRRQHCHRSRKIKFIGVWDTVGAMGIPISFLGLFEDKDEFYDTKLGSNVEVARHALAIDELREDFEPTIWTPRKIDMKQVWFAGSHGDVGGSYKPDEDGALLSDVALSWLVRQARGCNLSVEKHLDRNIKPRATATLHKSRRSFYRVRGEHLRPIDHGKGQVLIHQSVKTRWDELPEYRPKNLVQYIDKFGWPDELEK